MGSQPPAEPGRCGEGPARSPPAAPGEVGKGWPRGGEFPRLFSPTNSSACAIREICLTNSRGSGAGRWGGAQPGALLAQARSLPARAFDQRRASPGERSGSPQPDSGQSRAVLREAPRPLQTSRPWQPPALATRPLNRRFAAPSCSLTLTPPPSCLPGRHGPGTPPHRLRAAPNLPGRTCGHMRAPLRAHARGVGWRAGAGSGCALALFLMQCHFHQKPFTRHFSPAPLHWYSRHAARLSWRTGY